MKNSEFVHNEPVEVYPGIIWNVLDGEPCEIPGCWNKAYQKCDNLKLFGFYFKGC